jgi:eukaryotic translation initiation factor 2C
VADPAVYYAHLASNRAKHHELKPASAGPPSSDEERQKEELLRLKKLADEEKGPELTKSQKEKLHRFTSAEAAWLIPMKNDHKIWFGMWYI